MCVRSLGYIVGASPPLCEYMCVRSLGYIVDASPLVCVLSLVENLCWILACCLVRFEAFFDIVGEHSAPSRCQTSYTKVNILSTKFLLA